MLEQVEKQMQDWVDALEDETTSALYKRVPAGKRLRAKLALKIAPHTQESIKLAAVIELIHASSLLHDDVIDDAMTRRGVASINATEGSKTSIMLGDILYSKAYFELSGFSKAIAQSVSSAVTKLSIGELLDVEYSKAFNDNKEKYLDMIYKKTASLIECCCESAALISNKDAQKLALYGKNLGLAFQIIDDILDITQDEATLGKPALNDFVEGKTTLPYIDLYQCLSEDERIKLKSFHMKNLSEEEKTWVKTKMAEHQCIEKSYALARELSNSALDAIRTQELPELELIVETMMKRSF